MSRRAFLGTAAGTLLALAAHPGRARASLGSRRLRMLNVHTGERIDVTYCEHGEHLPEALAALDRFLRDFRTGEVHRIDPAALDIVWSIAATAERPLATFEIVSGYRSRRTNEMLRASGHGVAPYSLHVQGKAIDLRMAGVATDRVREIALALGRGGVGYYPRSDFVHVDTGRVRRW